MSVPDTPAAQPVVYRLMAELHRCRERLAPQLPQYAARGAPPMFAGEEPYELYDSLGVLFDEVHTAYVQEYGARCSWRRAGSQADAMTLLGQPYLQVFDAEPEDWTNRSALDYLEGSLRAVARAYKRECGWDHAPGAPSPGYVWVCVYEPRWSSFDEDARDVYFNGSLVGFAIAADRDEDGEPEALAHLWVARQARRAGHATLLLAEAERRFPALRTVERPVTRDGEAFVAARSPRLSADPGRA